MATEAQILINRPNAQKCTGPRTNRLSCPACQRIMTSIMQNKANFRKAQTNSSYFLTKDYENKRDWTPGENKPKTNPNKANFTYPQRGKTEVRCRMSEVRYLSSAFCFLSSVHERG